jgi:DNA-binding NtrC family response regulator
MHHLPPLGLGTTRQEAPTVQSLDSVTLPVGTTVDAAERALIDLTLRHTRNNRTRAAAILGISTKTLFNKLRETGPGSTGTGGAE